MLTVQPRTIKVKLCRFILRIINYDIFLNIKSKWNNSVKWRFKMAKTVKCGWMY